MDDSKALLNPKHEIGILRRYLHILALLQNKQDRKDWNSRSLADTICLDPNIDTIEDKVIRGDIEKYLEGDLGFSVSRVKGGRRSELETIIDDKTLLSLLMTYADFVIYDSSRSLALSSLIAAKKDICLWLLARLHFAAITKNKIEFDYTTNVNDRLNVSVHPYHLVLRANRIYLVGMRDSDRTVGPYLLSRIDNLKILDAKFDEEIPSAEDLYKHSYSGFIWHETVEISIRYNSKIENNMLNDFGSLEPVISKEGEIHTMRFLVFDFEAVCRQLFFYGNDVEILSPTQAREWMIEKLDSAMSVYRK
jgi:hypothetical protein